MADYLIQYAGNYFYIQCVFVSTREINDDHRSCVAHLGMFSSASLINNLMNAQSAETDLSQDAGVEIC